MAADVVEDDTSAGRLPSPRTSELLVAEVERFDVLLNDLLEVSRFDAGEAVLEVEDVDLGVLVREWVAALQPLAAEQGCALVVAGPTSCPVQCDPRRVGRVVRNLVVNAIEYGAGQPVEITLAAGDPTTVSVTDHGVGLDSVAAERVFERFWRADPSRRRTLGGTGLGLAISREDARLHGGDLTVTATPGAGCRFTLQLPSSPTERGPDPSPSVTPR